MFAYKNIQRASGARANMLKEVVAAPPVCEAIVTEPVATAPVADAWAPASTASTAVAPGLAELSNRE